MGYGVCKSWETIILDNYRDFLSGGLLMNMTAFPYPIFKRRIIYGNDLSSQFQICGGNFKFLTFMVCKSWKTLLFGRSIFWMWILMNMTAFPYPIFKSKTIFGNNVSSQFQICSRNFNFSIFRVCKSQKLSFLEGQLLGSDYWWIWLLSQVQFSKVGPV